MLATSGGNISTTDANVTTLISATGFGAGTLTIYSQVAASGAGVIYYGNAILGAVTGDFSLCIPVTGNGSAVTMQRSGGTNMSNVNAIWSDAT